MSFADVLKLRIVWRFQVGRFQTGSMKAGFLSSCLGILVSAVFVLPLRPAHGGAISSAGFQLVFVQDCQPQEIGSRSSSSIVGLRFGILDALEHAMEWTDSEGSRYLASVTVEDDPKDANGMTVRPDLHPESSSCRLSFETKFLPQDQGGYGDDGSWTVDALVREECGGVVTETPFVCAVRTGFLEPKL